MVSEEFLKKELMKKDKETIIELYLQLRFELFCKLNKLKGNVAYE